MSKDSHRVFSGFELFSALKSPSLVIGTALWVPEASEWNRLEPDQQPPTCWKP